MSRLAINPYNQLILMVSNDEGAQIMETLNSIECFVRSAEAGSFSEAARRLGLTSAAVGKNVAKLEANVGVRLFQRTTRRVALTPEGRHYLGRCRDVLAAVAEADASLADDTSAPRGPLMITAPVLLGQRVVTALAHRATVQVGRRRSPQMPVAGWVRGVRWSRR